MLRIQPQNVTVPKWTMRSDVIPNKAWAVLEKFALAPRIVNDLPGAEYPIHAFASISDTLTLPDKAGASPSNDAIVPFMAAKYIS